MRKIVELVFHPIQALGRHGVSDKIIKFFDKRPYLIYIFAFLITLGYIFFKYIFPQL